MNHRWGRYLVFAFIAGIILLAAAALTLWLKLRGTPVPPVGNAAISPGVSGPQEIRLWPGKAPGSEDWTRQETETNLFGERYVRNIVDPTLTAYFPAPGTANGTAVIVCPGGGFHALYIDSEGAQAARYLNSIGVTAFVLKYRLVQTGPAYFLDEFRRFKTPGGMNRLLDRMTPLIVADGLEALRIVRAHASQWGLAPDRIGIIGFSAGGYLALSLAYRPDQESRLDFIALLYPLAPDDALSADPAHSHVCPLRSRRYARSSRDELRQGLPAMARRRPARRVARDEQGRPRLRNDAAEPAHRCLARSLSPVAPDFASPESLPALSQNGLHSLRCERRRGQGVQCAVSCERLRRFEWVSGPLSFRKMA